MNTYTSAQRFLITTAVMLVAVMEVLDMTIVNVSLPAMMGALGASSDQITWVLTSYIVSSAIFMPLTGLLVKYFGRKRLLLMNIFGFLIASMLCGIATNLLEMVAFRILQGVFGASLVPLSQYILRDTFPPESQGKAMAIWGIGIMTGPVLGPTLGGYITQALDWRWVFYINVPVSIFAFFLSMRVIEETPREQVPIDWLGMLLMTLGIGTFQIFLDQGNNKNWFESNQIILLFFTAIVSLIWFVVRSLRHPHPLINFKIFKDKNFVLSSSLLMVFCATMLGIVALFPMMLEQIMHYPTGPTGWIMAPRGIASAIAMGFVARLITLTSVRNIILLGLGFAALGTWLSTQFSLHASIAFMMWTGVVQGLGMGFFFVPLSMIAFASLPNQLVAEASGLFSFFRSMGCSIGISSLSTLLSRQMQLHWQHLTNHITPYNPNFQNWLANADKNLADAGTPSLVANVITQQAGMLSFLNLFWMVLFSFVVLAPFLFLLENAKISKLSMPH